jgi:hypothetical protein
VLPPEFDWDRLEEVFAKLEGDNILTLPHAVTEHDDAMADAMAHWRRRGMTASGLHGYVYALKRDVAEVTVGRPFHISVGTFTGDAANSRAVADRVREAFAGAGYVVTVPVDAPDCFEVFPARLIGLMLRLLWHSSSRRIEANK